MSDKYPSWSPYNYSLNNPLINIDPDGKSSIRFFIKTVKNVWREVNRSRAIVEVANNKKVLVTGPGKSKIARKLMKDAKPGSKLVRHEGHKLKNGKTGKPHWQKKTGGGGKSLYGTINAILGGLILGIFETPLAGNPGAQGVGNPGEDLDGDGQDDSTQEVWSPGYIPEGEQDSEPESEQDQPQKETDNENDKKEEE